MISEIISAFEQIGPAIPSNLEADILSFKYVSTLACILIALTLSGCEWIELMQSARRLRDMADSTQRDTTTTDVIATRDADGRQAALLSAFYGLDDA